MPPDNASCLQIGMYPLTLGLAHSDNYIAVRVGRRVGLPTFRETLAAAGLISEKQKSVEPAVLPGTVEASLGEVVSACSTFSRGGSRVSPHFVKSVKISGNVVFTSKPSTSPVFSRSTCAAVHEGLREVMISGTGARAT